MLLNEVCHFAELQKAVRNLITSSPNASASLPLNRPNVGAMMQGLAQQKPSAHRRRTGDGMRQTMQPFVPRCGTRTAQAVTTAQQTDCRHPEADPAHQPQPQLTERSGSRYDLHPSPFRLIFAPALVSVPRPCLDCCFRSADLSAALGADGAASGAAQQGAHGRGHH